MGNYKRYFYKGPIYGSFDKIIEECWIGETLAPSRKKAVCNFRYQFCKERNLHQYTFLRFDPRKLICDEEVSLTDYITNESKKKDDSKCQNFTQLKLF